MDTQVSHFVGFTCTSVCPCIPVFLYTSLSVNCMPTCLSLSADLPFHLSTVWLLVCLSVTVCSPSFLPVCHCLPTFLFTSLSTIWPPVCLCSPLCMSSYLSVHLSIIWFTCFSNHLSAHLFVCLPVCPHVFLPSCIALSCYAVKISIWSENSHTWLISCKLSWLFAGFSRSFGLLA